MSRKSCSKKKNITNTFHSAVANCAETTATALVEATSESKNRHSCWLLDQKWSTIGQRLARIVLVLASVETQTIMVSITRIASLGPNLYKFALSSLQEAPPNSISPINHRTSSSFKSQLTISTLLYPTWHNNGLHCSLLPTACTSSPSRKSTHEHPTMENSITCHYQRTLGLSQTYVYYTQRLHTAISMNDMLIVDLVSIRHQHWARDHGNTAREGCTYEAWFSSSPALGCSERSLLSRRFQANGRLC